MIVRHGVIGSFFVGVVSAWAIAVSFIGAADHRDANELAIKDKHGRTRIFIGLVDGQPTMTFFSGKGGKRLSISVEDQTDATSVNLYDPEQEQALRAKLHVDKARSSLFLFNSKHDCFAGLNVDQNGYPDSVFVDGKHDVRVGLGVGEKMSGLVITSGDGKSYYTDKSKR